MLKWIMLFLTVAATAGCLVGLGVGARAMAKMLIALAAMAGAASLMAWPFLRRPAEAQRLEQLPPPRR
jgi:hypothetical protein